MAKISEPTPPRAFNFSVILNVLSIVDSAFADSIAFMGRAEQIGAISARYNIEPYSMAYQEQAWARLIVAEWNGAIGREFRS